jgi:hypothetical protein
VERSNVPEGAKLSASTKDSHPTLQTVHLRGKKRSKKKIKTTPQVKGFRARILRRFITTDVP